MSETTTMQVILNIATLLGGITAVWFLYEKRLIIFGWFRISFIKSINPLSLPDEEFTFLFEKARLLQDGPYLPVSVNEERLCKSLVNLKVLKAASSNMYKLSCLGKKMLPEKVALKK